MFRRRHGPPVQPAGKHVLPAIAHHLQVGVIGVGNLVAHGEVDADDVRLDQPPEPAFAVPQLLLGPAALDELPDLPAHGSHHFQQHLIAHRPVR